MPESSSSTSLNRSGPAYFLGNPWLYPLIACLLLVVLLSLRKIGTYDLGFHLKGGQWIVQHLAYPQKDSFTYTQVNRDYLDSNGFYQILLYGLFKFFGYPSLTIFNACVILAVFITLWFRSKPTLGPPWIVPILLVASVICMERRFIVRPEVLSWLYLSLTLWILDQRFTQRKSFIFLLPLILWLWANSEGLFPLGWAAMGAYLLGGWYHHKRMDWPLARYSLLSIAVGFLNPYGLKGFSFPFLLWTRLQDSRPYKQTIAEFFSPWHALQIQNLEFDSHFNLFIFFFLALAGLITLALTFRQRKLQELLLYLVFLFLALKAIRNVPLFMLIAMPVLSASWSGWKTGPRWSWLSKPSMAFALSIFVLLWCLRVLTNAYYINDRRNDRMGLGLDLQVLPVKAAQFLSQNALDGKLLNDLDSGGWLDWQAPQPTFTDGRLEVPEDSFYEQTMASFNPGGLIPLLAVTDAQLVVLEYNSSTPWVDQLNRFSNWRLIYLDECTAIYARWDYAPQIPIFLFSPFLSSKGVPNMPDGLMETQLQDLKPSSFKSWLRGFYLPQTYDMGDFSMGLFALRSRSYSPARDLLAEGLHRTSGDYPEVFFNLAMANLQLKDDQAGRLCLRYCLQLAPQNQEASRMLIDLGHMNDQ